MKNRNVILGIDGVPFDLMDKLSEKDIMPNFKELKKAYSFKKLKSSIPHISSVSWSSIITGKNPGEHGIYGFTELIKNTYTLSFPNFNALKCKPFWHDQEDKIHVIINVPSTYPAKELNGIHIAGFVALELEKAIYPKHYINYLKDIGYEIDVDSKIAHKQSIDIFFNELHRVLSLRKKVYQYFWDKLKWDNFMIVLTGTDRIGHFFWHIYEDESNTYNQRFLDYFTEIDNIIGDIKNKLEEDDTFLILSDHGMELTKQNVNLNTYLEQEGYLELSNESKNYNRITKSSKAFVLDPGRIYLNMVNKFPNGSVTEKDKTEVLDDLKTLFLELKYKNQKVIKKVYEKEEIYHGKMLFKAPDLVLIENSGFQIKGVIGRKQIFETDQFSGKHNSNAFLFLNNDIDLKDPTVEDVVGLLR